jgi:putative Mn2+ efflux pump MntP
MDPISLIGLALALAMDAFAVAVAVGLTRPRLSFRPMFRLSFHFGLFQFMMPVIGWLAGLSVARWIADYDHWAAFGLLVGIGLKMIWESRAPPRSLAKDPTRGVSLAMLSVATSIDALAAGVTLALQGITIWGPSVVIGAVAAAMTVLGMILGRRVGLRLGRVAWVVGGLILAALGTRILLEHLLAG